MNLNHLTKTMLIGGIVLTLVALFMLNTAHSTETPPTFATNQEINQWYCDNPDEHNYTFRGQVDEVLQRLEDSDEIFGYTVLSYNDNLSVTRFLNALNEFLETNHQADEIIFFEYSNSLYYVGVNNGCMGWIINPNDHNVTLYRDNPYSFMSIIVNLGLDYPSERENSVE